MDDSRDRKDIQPSLGAFGQRRNEPSVWNGGEGTGDVIDFIGPSIAQSSRKVTPSRKPRMQKEPEYQPLGSGKHVDNVVYYDAERRFGRIGDERLFFHITAVTDGNTEFIRKGVKVAYEETVGRDGRAKAIDVQLVDINQIVGELAI